MASYLVTGTGRGIGLEIVKQLSSLPHSQVSTIFATTRSTPSVTLQSLIDQSNGRVVHVPVQITEKTSIEEAVAKVSDKLGDKGLDVLVNNAGVMPFTEGGVEKMSDLRDAFEVNVEAVHNVIAAFMPLLRKGGLKKVANMYA